MLKLLSIAQWLIEQDPTLETCCAVGTIDGNAERFIGVYNDKNSSGKQRVCLGGKAATRYLQKDITLLVHWTRNPTEAEEKALELYERFYSLSHICMGETQIISVDPGNAPIPIGRDEKGIFEYVINLKILYEREEF